MNLRELITMTYDLQKHYGNYRGIPETQDTVQLLNQALRFIGRKLKIYDPAISFSITEDQPIYRLDSEAFGKVITRLDHVIVNGVMLKNAGGSKPGLWAVAELNRKYPSWRTNSTSSNPILSADYGSNKVLLYPMPNEATAEATNHFASGWILPGVMLSTGEYGRLGFGLVDKADLPAGYGGEIPGGGPQPTFNGAGGGMGGGSIPGGVLVYSDPPAGGGGTGGGGFGEPGGTGGGGGHTLFDHNHDDFEGGPGELSVPSGPGQGGTSQLVWDMWSEPDLVVDLHELLCYYSALKFAEPLASDEAMFAKLNTIRGDLMSLVTEVANSYESKQMPWGDSAGGGSQFDWRVRF